MRRPDWRLQALSLALLVAAPAAAADPKLGGISVPAYAFYAIAPSGVGKGYGTGFAEFGADGKGLRGFGSDNPVRIASISKVAVALALHRLADAGKLRLDDDVSRYLGWRLRNPAHPDVPISIRQMLRHESSLSDAAGYTGVLGQRQRDRISPTSFSAAAPGTAFDYANLNHALLGEVIEHVTGERFDRAMQRLVFQPLKIDACFNWSGCSVAAIADGAVLYRKAPSDAGPWDASGPWIAQVDAKRPPDACPVRTAEGAPCQLEAYVPGTDGSLFSPQGGLRISLESLARLGRALLDDNSFLKPASRASLFRPVRVKSAGSGAETDPGLMQYWSEGGLHCFSGTGKPGGDQPFSPVRLTGCGHLGDAYGLRSGLVIDPARRTVITYAFTGVSAPPPPGRVSRFSAPEEDLVALAYRLLPADK